MDLKPCPANIVLPPVTEEEHSLLGPSGAEWWMGCAAGPARCKGLPGKTSEYADEGTLAHAIAAFCLKGGFTLEPGTTVNGQELPDDMIPAVQTYLETVRSMSEGAIQTLIEETLDISEILGVPGQMGTGDCIALLPEELQVHDYKHGKGVAVSAIGNKQTRLYGLGAMHLPALVELVELLGLDIKTVRLVIHQPRLNSVTEEVVTCDELYAFAVEARAAARKAWNLYRLYDGTQVLDDDDFGPSEGTCRWCLAKGGCKALADHCLEIMGSGFDNLTAGIKAATENVPTLPNARLSVLLQNLDLITQWIAAVKDHAMSEALAGHEIPGFKLVEGRAGNRQWTSEKEAETLLKSMRCKKQEMYTFKVIGVPAAEKLLKLSVRKWNRASALITRSDPKPALVPVTDKRPALVLEAPAGDFEDLTGGTDAVPSAEPECDLV
jgi:hypothetical protein